MHTLEPSVIHHIHGGADDAYWGAVTGSVIGSSIGGYFSFQGFQSLAHFFPFFACSYAGFWLGSVLGAALVTWTEQPT